MGSQPCAALVDGPEVVDGPGVIDEPVVFDEPVVVDGTVVVVEDESEVVDACCCRWPRISC